MDILLSTLAALAVVATVAAVWIIVFIVLPQQREENKYIEDFIYYLEDRIDDLEKSLGTPENVQD